MYLHEQHQKEDWCKWSCMYQSWDNLDKFNKTGVSKEGVEIMCKEEEQGEEDVRW